jgi:hypothetical protein
MKRMISIYFNHRSTEECQTIKMRENMLTEPGTRRKREMSVTQRRRDRGKKCGNQQVATIILLTTNRTPLSDTRRALR